MPFGSFALFEGTNDCRLGKVLFPSTLFFRIIVRPTFNDKTSIYISFFGPVSNSFKLGTVWVFLGYYSTL